MIYCSGVPSFQIFLLNSGIGNFRGFDVSVLTAASTSVLLTVYAVAIAIGIKKVIGPYLKKGLITDIGKIFLSGIAATLVYVVFNTFLKEFTHGYITFLVPLIVCGITYGAMLFVTGMLKRLMKREREDVK